MCDNISVYACVYALKDTRDLYLFHSQRESAMMLLLTSLSCAQKHRTVHTMLEHAGFLGKLTYFIHRVGSGQNPRILFR